MNCPSCSNKIHWSEIAFAAIPIWISCKSCKTKLVGDKTIKIQTAAVFFLSLILGLVVARLDENFIYKSVVCVIGFFIIVVTGVIFSLKKGKYFIGPS